MGTSSGRMLASQSFPAAPLRSDQPRFDFGRDRMAVVKCQIALLAELGNPIAPLLQYGIGVGCLRLVDVGATAAAVVSANMPAQQAPLR